MKNSAYHKYEILKILIIIVGFVMMCINLYQIKLLMQELVDSEIKEGLGQIAESIDNWEKCEKCPENP